MLTGICRPSHLSLPLPLRSGFMSLALSGYRANSSNITASRNVSSFSRHSLSPSSPSPSSSVYLFVLPILQDMRAYAIRSHYDRGGGSVLVATFSDI